jgi:hypothetical protein
MEVRSFPPCVAVGATPSGSLEASMIATPRGAATTWPQWIALSLYGLALTMTSNIVDPPWLSQKASQLAGPGWQNTLLGSVAFIGLVWAALVQPIFGAWSDQLRSPWGRRKPFLWLGSLLLALALALLVAAPSVPMLILALLLVQTFSNMVQAAYQGLIPGLSSFLRVGYYWAEDREEVERWSALPGRCPFRRGREADEMREVEPWSRLG